MTNISEPIEATRGKKIGQRILKQCDAENLGPFVAMFAAQVVLVKCCEVARRAGNAAAWNAWLKAVIEILYLPEATS